HLARRTALAWDPSRIAIPWMLREMLRSIRLQCRSMASRWTSNSDVIRFAILGHEQVCNSDRVGMTREVRKPRRLVLIHAAHVAQFRGKVAECRPRRLNTARVWPS